MSTSTVKVDALAVDVRVTEDEIELTLADGRHVSAPLEWFPTLRDATAGDRSNWRLIGRGIGVHWPALDEDISVSSLLAVE